MKSPSDRPTVRPSDLLLGADAGGSHCTVVIAAPDLRVLGRAEGPAAAMRPGGATATAAVLAETARRAAVQAGVELPVERGVVGAAGAGRSQEQAELATALIAVGVARRVRVLADAEVALTAAFGGGPGILLTAGTGSIAFARDPTGSLHRAGGYGWQLGDEGGGYWIGRSALAIAARAGDGRGDGSTLLARLLGALGLQQFDDLVRWTATATPAQVAALAPHVLNAAREGEAVARQTVTAAANELVELVAALARYFPGSAPVPVALAGGLLLPDSPLTTALRSELTMRLARARLVSDRIDVALGALRLAAALE